MNKPNFLKLSLIMTLKSSNIIAGASYLPLTGILQSCLWCLSSLKANKPDSEYRFVSAGLVWGAKHESFDMQEHLVCFRKRKKEISVIECKRVMEKEIRLRSELSIPHPPKKIDVGPWNNSDFEIYSEWDEI